MIPDEVGTREANFPNIISKMYTNNSYKEINSTMPTNITTSYALTSEYSLIHPVLRLIVSFVDHKSLLTYLSSNLFVSNFHLRRTFFNTGRLVLQ